MRKIKNRHQKLILDDAIGNIYRAALFLARDPKEKKLAETMLVRALKVLAQFNFQSKQSLVDLKNRIKKVQSKKERLVLAELILDEYKKLAGIA